MTAPMDSDAGTTLELQGIHQRFGDTAVLKGIDLSIAAGEFLILVGPSGCGKSTLLNILAGLDTPSAGQVFLAGRNVTHTAPKDRDIAMVFQSYALYPNMTVAQNIAFGLEMRKVPTAERRAIVQRVATMLRIEPLLARKPAALSGGQRQRVAMGRALARSPKLFLFDEPLSNLDAKLRVEMRAEIKLLHQRTRITTVYVTHDQVEAMTLGDRIAVMKDGVVQQFGTPDDIYTCPANAFVAAFMGSPAMNMIGAVGDAHGAVSAQSAALPAMQSVQDALQSHAKANASSELIYGVRPEHVKLVAAGAALGTPAIHGTVTMVEPTGPDTFVTVDTALGLMNCRVDGQQRFALADDVGLSWDARHAHVFDGRLGQRLG
jgi:multiple sugar transport system ATP-binding protein